MPREAPSAMSLDPRLSRLLTARLCHDLGGAVGTLEGTMGLVVPGDPTMLELAQETATMLRLRLHLYTAAWAGGATDLDPGGLVALLQGAPASPRVRFAADGLPAGQVLPAALVPIALNAALLGAEALPRGGSVALSGDAERGLAIRPEGLAAAWPPALPGALAGEAPDALLGGGPRTVLVPLLLALAAEAGWRVSLGAAPDAGCAPLLVGPG